MDLEAEERKWFVGKVQDLVSKGMTVEEACATLGKSKTTYYKWLKRSQNEGENGFKSRSKAHKSHPMTTPDYVKDEIVKIAIDNPNMSSRGIESYLKNNDYTDEYKKSRTIIREILNASELESKDERWCAFTDKLYREKNYEKLNEYQKEVRKYNFKLLFTGAFDIKLSDEKFLLIVDSFVAEIENYLTIFKFKKLDLDKIIYGLLVYDKENINELGNKIIDAVKERLTK